jgi:hypothetical protein
LIDDLGPLPPPKQTFERHPRRNRFLPQNDCRRASGEIIVGAPPRGPLDGHGLFHQ